MSRNSAVASQSSLANSTARQALLRAGAGLAALTALTLFASAAQAQGAPDIRPFELRPVVGALVPTGDQRDLLKDAVLVGAQASYSLTPSFAIVGTVGWVPSEDRLLAGEKVDLFQYDLGVEGRLRNLTPASSFSIRPYAAAGIGGRTYDYRDLDDADAQTNFLGYGALGLDVAQASGPFGIRIEARDNISGFKGLRGELTERKARNDVQLTAGLTVAF